jgi:hypothetical protein
MGEIPVGKKLNIFLLGIVASLLLYFVFQTLFASVIVDVFLGTFENQFILFLIILGFETIALIISIPVSFWITDDIQRSSVYKAALFSYLFNVVFLIVISYISLLVLYPEVFSEVSGAEIILIFPTVLVYFSIYVLGLPIYFFILSIFTYYLFFIILIDRFYKYRSKYRN